MGWLGKIIGGAVGFAFGGPVGAAIGAAAGHGLFDSQELPDDEQRQQVFFVAIFAILAKMAKADGRVSEDEIKVVDNIMRNDFQLDMDSRKYAIEIFRHSLSDGSDVEQYLIQFAQINQFDQETGYMFLQILFGVAMADGILHENEMALLQQAERIFRLPAGTVNNLTNGSSLNSTNDISDAYETLGVTINHSDTEIKSAYREKSKQFHPDHLYSKGLPPEFTQFANDQMIKIKEAYEIICKERNI